MDFTGKYIESTYEKVLHIHSGSVYDGTGSLVSPTFSGSVSVIGDMIVTSGSVYVDGQELGAITSSYSDYALTSSYSSDPLLVYQNKTNHFTGSQYFDSDLTVNNSITSLGNTPSYFGGQIQGSGSLVIDTSANRHEDGTFSYGIYNKSVYTGSTRVSSVFVDTEVSSSVDVSNASGITSQLKLMTATTSSQLTAGQNLVYNYGYISSKLQGGTNVPSNYGFANDIITIKALSYNHGSATNQYGVWIKNNAAGVTENQYGIYIDDIPQATSQSYAIYSEPNVPSYFGGKLEASISAPTSSVTPTDSGSIAFQLDESGDKILFRVKYSDGTIKSGSSDLF